MVDGIDDLTSCALSRVLVATLGGKWKPYIIWYLSLQLPESCALRRAQEDYSIQDIGQDVFATP